MHWIKIGAHTACLILFLLILRKSGHLALANDRQDTDWKKVNLQALSLPDYIDEYVTWVPIMEHRKIILDHELLFQTANPLHGDGNSGRVILLLHGAAFTSQTWVDKVPTMATMAALGHNVIAVDLPGYGKSPDNNAKKEEFMHALLSSLIPGVKPVVVSPSMSGGFMMALLQKYPEMVAAWVPVAPGNTDSAGDDFFKNLSVPTMIVYGEKDRSLGLESKKNLVKIPTSTLPQVLPGAKHPAYLDQPRLWHTLLYNFLNALSGYDKRKLKYLKFFKNDQFSK